MKLTAKHGAESGDTASAADCQGTSAVIRKYPQLSADLNDGEEQTTRPLCNKETGGKKNRFSGGLVDPFLWSVVAAILMHGSHFISKYSIATYYYL